MPIIGEYLWITSTVAFQPCDVSFRWLSVNDPVKDHVLSGKTSRKKTTRRLLMFLQFSELESLDSFVFFLIRFSLFSIFFFLFFTSALTVSLRLFFNVVVHGCLFSRPGHESSKNLGFLFLAHHPRPLLSCFHLVCSFTEYSWISSTLWRVHFWIFWRA